MRLSIRSILLATLIFAFALSACGTSNPITPSDGTVFGPGESIPVVVGNAVEKIVTYQTGTTVFNIKYFFVNAESDQGIIGTNELFVFFASLKDAISYACRDAKTEKERGNSVS